MPAVSIENCQHYTWGDNCDGWHLIKTQQLSVIQERMPPGAKEARHSHQHAEQFFYVLSGTATMFLDGKPLIIAPNHGIHVPAGQSHQICNKHAQELIFTVTSTPPSHGDRIEQA